MKRLNCLALMLLMIPPIFAPAARLSSANTNLEAFEGEIEQLRTLLKIPGISVAIVEGKRVLWAKGFGYRDYENKMPASPETLYPIASLTKTLTATLVMQAVEQGQLSLDDPVAKYRNDFDVDSDTTVRNYLTHTSEDMRGLYFYYSGARFSRLTTVLEKAVGKSFKDLIAGQVFKKVGMERSVPGLNAEGYSQALGGLSKLYVLKDGQPVQSDYEGGMSAASGALSTVLDLAKYELAIRENALISEGSRRMMFTPAVSNGGRALPYGLGWFVQDFSGHKVVWAYGQESANSALLVSVPDRALTLIALANSIALSDPFWLILGNVKRSPVALAFLRRFVPSGPGAEVRVQPDWDEKLEKLSPEPSLLEAKIKPGNYGDELIAHAFALQWLGDRPKSAALLKLAIERYPSVSTTADPALLAVLARSGDPELRRVGEKIGQALVNENPDNPKTLFDLGVLYQQSQRVELAVPVFERLAAKRNLSTKWMLAYSGLYLGEFYMVKDPVKAKKYLQLVLDVGPGGGSQQQKARDLLGQLEKRSTEK
ncbi:MAG: serine hydrolase domain-containing protein [Acidobacteriota bacterium]